MKKIFSLIILSVFLFSACSREDEMLETGEMESIPIEEKEEGIHWNDIHISLDNCFKKALIKDGVIYGYSVNDNGVSIVMHDAQSGSTLREIEIKEAADVSSIAVDGSQNIYLLGIMNRNDTVWKIDKKGQVSVITDFVLEDMDNAIRFSTYALFVDDNGYFYFWCKLDIPSKEFFEDAENNVYTEADRIYVKDNQMNTLFYEQVPYSRGFRLLNFSLGEKGIPAILAEDPEGIYLQELDTARKKASSQKRISKMSEIGTYESFAVTEDGFLFCKENILCKYFIEQQEIKEILNLSTCGVFSSDILYLGISDRNIEMISSFEENSSTEYISLRKGQSDKIQITLGVMQTFQELETVVTRFNRSRDDIRIEIVPYYDEQNGFDASIEKLNLDIISGKAPDILETSMIDYELLSQKGVFADLYQYMDADFGKEHVLEKILQIYELNGHLYTIAPYFQLHTMWGNSSVAKGRYGLTLEEMMDLLETQGRDINAIYGFSADEPVLTTLCAMGMDEFIDWENGSCNFERENFASVLEFVKSYNGGYTEGSLSAGIQNGDILLSAGIISSVADYQIQSKLYGGNLSFVGYPVSSGTGTAVSLKGAQVAINAKSQNSTLAWEFIKYYLTEEDSNLGFPVVRERYEALTEETKKAVYTSTDEGDVELPQMTYADTDTYIAVYAATPDDIDAINALIEMADSKFKYHTKIQNIIEEETAYFFNGQKEIPEVAALIQNRITLLINE